MAFTIHLSSSDAFGSSSSEFTIPLARELELNGEWCCCLQAFICTKRAAKTNSAISIMVCSDMCTTSLVNNKPLPVLALVPLKFQLKAPLEESYVPLRAANARLSNINIYLTDEAGVPISFDLGRVSCSLHFKQIREKPAWQVQHSGQNTSQTWLREK